METKKVLVLEDDAYIVDFVTHVLKEMGYDVLVARDGKEALEKISKEVPALVLMDYMMPKMNAFQICEELSKSEKTRDIPKILMSASAKVGLDERTQKYGIKFLMKKPFFANDLIKNVKSVLSI